MIGRQKSLFEQPTLNVARRLKESMALVVDRSGLSRDEILDRMNALAEKYGVRLVGGNSLRLTMDTFEKWLNPNDMGRVINVKALPVFCAATESIEPMMEMVGPLGWMIIDDDDARLLQWAKLYRQAQEAKRAMRTLEAGL